MLLQRRLVILLEKYRINLNLNPDRELFVKLITQGKWPRWNYFLLNNDKFSRTIDGVLGDCIRGSLGYIAEDEGSEKLLVTLKGREFIKKSKLLEEILKRYRRSSQLLFSSAVASTATGLVVHFWPWIKATLGF